MPIAVRAPMQGFTAESYKEFNRKAFGNENGPEPPPQGLIIHTAGEVGGEVVVFDVWESREDFERFVKQYIEPMMEGQEGLKPETYELTNVLNPALSATR
jgi:hypothetical protein